MIIFVRAVFTFCWFLKTWPFPQDVDNCNDQKWFQPLNFGSISELRSHCSSVKYFRITTTISQSYYNPGTEFLIVFLNPRNETLLKIITMTECLLISYHFWAFSKYSQNAQILPNTMVLPLQPAIVSWGYFGIHSILWSVTHIHTWNIINRKWPTYIRNFKALTDNPKKPCTPRRLKLPPFWWTQKNAFSLCARENHFFWASPILVKSFGSLRNFWRLAQFSK